MTFPKSISNHANSLLTDFSHGAIGCAYGLYEAVKYNRNKNSNNKLLTIANNLLKWEICEYDEKILNWNDYRTRSQSEFGELAWSHGSPGILLTLSYLMNSSKEASEFLSRLAVGDVLTKVHILKRKQFVNATLCHGTYGYLSIVKKLNCNIEDAIALLRWSNIQYFSELDSSHSRSKMTDSPSLMTGKSGIILGALYYLEQINNVPLLPHEFIEL